jgi:hypothetical protein
VAAHHQGEGLDDYAAGERDRAAEVDGERSARHARRARPRSSRSSSTARSAAAAAPIIRQLADVPSKVVGTIAEHIQNNYDWRQAVRAGKTVPLKTVEHALQAVLNYPFAEVDEKVGYAGDTFVVKGKRYAVDRDDYWKHEQAKLRKAQVASPSPASTDDWRKKQAEADRRRRVQTDRAEKLRAAQVAAVNAKLPAELSGGWLLWLVDRVMDGVDGANLAELAGIELPKDKTTFGPGFNKLIRSHVERLDTKGRQRFLLQIVLSDSLGAYGDVNSLKAAAKLVRVDLSKVKPPADEKAAPTPAKKKARR